MGSTTIVLWKRAVKHMENQIHCMVKQQWQHMEVHPLLIKSVVRTDGKLKPLFFEREQWQHVENYLSCFLNKSDNISKTIHCLLSVRWQHTENKIHCFLREGSDNMWKTTSNAKWNSNDNIWKSIHCLLNVPWQQIWNNIHCSLKVSSNNIWKIKFTAWWNSSNSIRKSIHCLLKVLWE